MISYPFISDLFTAILSKSKAIEGRFYVCPKGGSEINSDVLGQVIKDNTANLVKKYPLCLMMPPKSQEQAYYITLFFLKTTYYGEGSAINPNTLTSTHTIEQDWHDMKRCSDNFLKVLRELQVTDNYKNFAVTRNVPITTPVSEIGIDNASGVRLDFQLELRGITCEPIEDYNESDIELITVPVGDSHPEHQM